MGVRAETPRARGHRPVRGMTHARERQRAMEGEARSPATRNGAGRAGDRETGPRPPFGPMVWEDEGPTPILKRSKTREKHAPQLGSRSAPRQSARDLSPRECARSCPTAPRGKGPRAAPPFFWPENIPGEAGRRPTGGRRPPPRAAGPRGTCARHGRGETAPRRPEISTLARRPPIRCRPGPIFRRTAPMPELSPIDKAKFAAAKRAAEFGPRTACGWGSGPDRPPAWLGALPRGARVREDGQDHRLPTSSRTA